MTGNVDKRTSKAIFTGKSNALVGQDNGASRPGRAASLEPAAVGSSPRAPGLSPDILNSIIDQSAKRAKANLTHLSPQITELIAAVEQWLGEEAERMVS